MDEANADPERSPSTSPSTSAGKTADELWMAAIADIKALLDRDGDAAWEEIRAQYDQFSLYEFLKQPRVLRGRDRVLRRHELRRDRHAQRRRGGAARGPRGRVRRHADDRRRDGPRCPTRSSRELQQEVRFGAEVRAHRARTGRRDRPLQDRSRPRSACPADYAICALPFPVAAHRRDHRGRSRTRSSGPSASSTTTRRPRSCSRSAHRFWETGGRHRRRRRTVTDLPIRRMNYPPPDPDDERGVLLASYTWGQDALQWGAMDRRRRVWRRRSTTWRASTRGSARSTRSGPRTPGTATAGRAARSRCSRPEQQTDLQADIVRPEGRVLLRRRALLAVPRVDPGRARVRHPRGEGDSRGALTAAGHGGRRSVVSACLTARETPRNAEPRTPQGLAGPCRSICACGTPEGVAEGPAPPGPEPVAVPKVPEARGRSGLSAPSGPGETRGWR